MLAVHLRLLLLREGRVVLQRAELVNFLVRAGRLSRKLVAGDIDDLKSLVMIRLVHCLERLIVRREAAAGRRVDDQHNLALVVREFQFSAADRRHTVIVNAHNLSFPVDTKQAKPSIVLGIKQVSGRRAVFRFETVRDCRVLVAKRLLRGIRLKGRRSRIDVRKNLGRKTALGKRVDDGIFLLDVAV